MKNETIYMQDYIKEVFNIVIELYKSVAPELIAEAFELNMDNVDKLNSQEVMKRLHDLQINYKIVEDKDKEQIWYHDLHNQRLLAKLTGQEINESDELRMYLYEPEILQKTSVEDIKRTRDASGMSKIISDINYITHEMAHAFEHVIKVQNPSYIDSSIYLLANQGNMIDYDLGEAFAMSMERVVLDKLKEDGQLELYNLDKYTSVSDIEDVWNKKRIIPFSINRGVLGKTVEGEEITYLDLDLIPYQFIQDNGMKNTIEHIKRLDFFALYKAIPNKNDTEKVSEFCSNVFTKKYDNYLIPEGQKYEPIYSREQILNLFKQRELNDSVKLIQELGRETLENQKDTQAKVNEENLIINLEQMIEREEREEREGKEEGEIR